MSRARGQQVGVPALMADLVRRRVAAIDILGPRQITIAAKAATSTIPIVFVVGDDPAKLGGLEQPLRFLSSAVCIWCLIIH
jgi:putative ABC transport system substrate-binding protein